MDRSHKIQRNSIVTLYHQIGYTDGSLLEDTFDDEPLTFHLGSGDLAEGLELSLLGLQEGDEQTLEIGPDLAFGYVDDKLVQTLPRDDFNMDYLLAPGLIIEFSTPNGETLPGTILEFDDNTVRVDFNHPLAGHTVRYRVKIIEVVNPEPIPEFIN
jgi:FKBP-type peptidyl-prolyl cis-trans isomerase SlpA